MKIIKSILCFIILLSMSTNILAEVKGPYSSEVSAKEMQNIREKINEDLGLTNPKPEPQFFLSHLCRLAVSGCITNGGWIVCGCFSKSDCPLGSEGSECKNEVKKWCKANPPWPC